MERATSIVQREKNPTVYVLVGATGAGKTAVSLPLAEALHAEIISADSRQIYRLMDIGTAKPTPAEQARVPHHFLDVCFPDEEYNAGLFGIDGRNAIDRILALGRVPLVVGGSGLYIRSLVDGLFDAPAVDREYRAFLATRLAQEGIGPLMEELRVADPVFAADVDPSKPRRVLRALEVYHTAGIPLSILQRERKPVIRFTPCFLGISWPRDLLHTRIETRFLAMIDAGLLEEVDGLLKRGYAPSLQAFSTVGYAEVLAYRRGEIDRETMVRQCVQHTRQYAKRQMTWFRRDHRIRWMDVQGEFEPEAVASAMQSWISAQEARGHRS